MGTVEAMPLSEAPVRGVVFDLDGTLYHMSWFMRPLFFLMLFPHGLRLPVYMKARKGLAGQDFGNGEALMAALCRELGSRVKRDPTVIRSWIDWTFYPVFVKLMPLFRNSRPGIRGMLEGMSRRGIRRGVLSDFGRVNERLLGLGLDPGLFDTVRSSEESGALKPCGRPVREIIRGWQLDPADVLVVGDRRDTDGAAAESIGARFAHITNNKRRSAGACTWQELVSRLAPPR